MDKNLRNYEILCNGERKVESTSEVNIIENSTKLLFKGRE